MKRLWQQSDPGGKTNLKMSPERLELANKGLALLIGLSPRVRAELDATDEVEPTGILLNIRVDFARRVNFGWFALVDAELI